MFDIIYILEFCSGSDEDMYKDIEPVAFKTLQEAKSDLHDRGYVVDQFGIYRFDLSNNDEDSYFRDSSYMIKELQLLK